MVKKASGVFVRQISSILFKTVFHMLLWEIKKTVQTVGKSLMSEATR